jgi:hypothetical protein
MTQTVVTRWWLIRHAPVVGTHGRVYGQMDVECDVSDAETLKALAARIPDGALWFATPLSRTQRTAQALSEQLRAAGRQTPASLNVEPAFIEQSFGEWQGRTYREIGAFGQGERTCAGHLAGIRAVAQHRHAVAVPHRPCRRSRPRPRLARRSGELAGAVTAGIAWSPTG